MVLVCRSIVRHQILWRLSSKVSRARAPAAACFVTYIVVQCSVSKFISKNLENLPAPPTLFTPCVVCEMIWLYPPQTTFKIVRPRPRIARCDGYCRWWREIINISCGSDRSRFGDGKSHGSEAAFFRQEGENPR